MAANLTTQECKKNKSTNILTARLAENVDELKLVQRLRAEAFGPAFDMKFENGLDEDRFDAYCAHLMVFDDSRLVATTRLMDRERACLAGGFYSEQEFDIRDALAATSGNFLEIGRTCVAPNYSSVRAIQTLWQGVAEVAEQWNTDILIGCASIPLGNGDCQGWLNSLPEKNRLSLPVRARRPLPLPISSKHPEVPTLLKTYLRMNARLGAQACFDPVFHCADVLIWLPIDEMTSKYRERLTAA
ncbi:MAG: L-ornithine N(alpha)-acyltransferase [Aquirhabdus sp.]